MKIAAVAALLSLTSCGYMIPQNRYNAYAADAREQATAKCAHSTYCYDAVFNDVYSKWMAKDRQAWAGVGGFDASPATSYAQAPMLPTPGYASSPTMVSSMNTCAMMSCQTPAAPPVKFVPYTSGGGNPSGYGLLSH